MQITNTITNISNFPSINISGHPWLMVQPDTRTYQETEIHILFDKAEEMDTPQGPASYSRGRGDGAEIDYKAEAVCGTENKSYEGNEKRVRITMPQVRQSCPPLSLSKLEGE